MKKEVILLRNVMQKVSPVILPFTSDCVVTCCVLKMQWRRDNVGD